MTAEAGRAKRVWILGVAVLLAPAAAYVAVLGTHLSASPMGDDYFSILPFLSAWRTAAHGTERLHLLTQQYFSHRILMTKCVALADNWLFGDCRLRPIEVLGWAGWLGIFAVLVLAAPAVRRRPALGLPVALLMMQPQGYTNLTSAMQAVQNIGVVAFGLAAIAAGRAASRWARPASWLLAACALLTSVNGLLALPVVIASWGRRDLRSTVAFSGLSLLLIAGYFSGYQGDPHPWKLGAFLANAAVMAGSWASLLRAGTPIALAAGAATWAVAIGTLASPRFRRDLPVPAAFLAFVLLTLLMAAFGRIGYGAAYMLQDRYRLYGILALSIAGLHAIHLIDGRRPWAGLGTALAGIFCLLSYDTYYSNVLTIYEWGQATLMNAQLGRVLPYTSPESRDAADANLSRALAEGVYRPPNLLSASDLAEIRLLRNQRPDVPGRGLIGKADSSLGSYVVSPAPEVGLEPAVFALGWSDGGPVILPRFFARARVSESLRSLVLDNPRQFFLLPTRYAEPADERILGLSRDPDGPLHVAWVARGPIAGPSKAPDGI
jgi:hypothetical protein